jgi:hypothetical protein
MRTSEICLSPARVVETSRRRVGLTVVKAA